MTPEIVKAISKQYTDKAISDTGFSAYAQIETTDATPTDIVTFTVEDNTVGVIEATVVGIRSDATVGGVTGKKIVRYKMIAGTITLGTATSLLAVETDIVGATFAFTTDGTTEITVQVTGVAATDITWNCVTNMLTVEGTPP